MAIQAQSIEPEVERAAISRAQGGEPFALEPVLSAHAESLFSSVILPRIGDRALAEDLLRDTFITALSKIDGFRWQGRSLFFWLRQIALNKLIDHHRRTGRARRLVDALVAEREAEAQQATPDETLIAEADRRRAKERIEVAIASLPERYARAVRLRLIEERPREACAEALGVTVGNFDVILFRAVRAFRAAYGERDEG